MNNRDDQKSDNEMPRFVEEPRVASPVIKEDTEEVATGEGREIREKKVDAGEMKVMMEHRGSDNILDTLSLTLRKLELLEKSIDI